MVEFRYLGKCLLKKLYIWDRISLENCENGYWNFLNCIQFKFEKFREIVYFEIENFKSKSKPDKKV